MTETAYTAELDLFLTTFDAAMVTECYRREQSIVPQQALALTNSRLVLDSAKPIAAKIAASLKSHASNVDDATFIGGDPATTVTVTR